VIAQFNGLWRQRLTSVALRCVLTQDVYRRLRNHRRVFLRFRTVFSFWSKRGFISFGKRIIFPTVRCKNWCQEISTCKLVNELFKGFLLPRWREFKTCVKYSYTLIQWLQFRHKFLKERITLMQWINRCPAIRTTDLLSFGNLDKTPFKNSRIWCSRILKHRSIDFIVRFVAEMKEAIFCLPLFIFLIYCKALRLLAILNIVWDTFLKSRNVVVIWQSAYEACRVHYSTVIKHNCLAF